ncbi:MAG: UDP-glucose/GDP-mannose dehydrogenase family protein [Planctomycetes bacterium]|nr:UDP-glucose/GDP-mannose dehydrogenase family protein [Planctomycetota bacterium]
MRITVAGTGYVGLVTAACLAGTGNTVLGYDTNERRIAELEDGLCPIFEPGLPELLSQGRQTGRMTFTTSLEKAAAHASVVFVAIGTPPQPDGSADMGYVESFATALAPLITRTTILVMKSTVPVGTGEKLEKLINARSKKRVHLVSNPEFLKEGSAVNDFQRPDRVIIGADDHDAAQIVRDLYVPFVRNQRPILIMRRAAAEMTKYASNAFLAARISLINEIANICDACGIDVEEVRRGMGTDQRIGFQFLYPGAGYGGSCFPKDVPALCHIAISHGVTPRMLNAVHEVNEAQKQLILQKITRRFDDQLTDLTVAVWGIAFKPNTDDIRDGPAVDLIDGLLDRGASVRLHDPQAMGQARARYEDRIEYFDDCYEAIDGANALAICTEWNEFRSPDFDRIRNGLAQPIIFDGRNLYEPETMRRARLEYYPIGRPAVTHVE